MSVHVVSSSSVFFWLCLIFVAYASLSPLIVDDQVLWTSGDEGDISFYRTPMLINTPNGDLLAFAGARKYSEGDTAQKIATMRRSRDKGASWDPTVFVIQDLGPETDYFNFGTITVDDAVNSLVFLYCHCPHNVCKDSLPTVFMMRSYDWGYTWSKPVNLSISNPIFYNFAYCPGPGYGIQKKIGPYKGRLISCGHTIKTFKAMHCIISDDHGDTWKLAGTVPTIPYGYGLKTGDFQMDETTIIELPDGSLMLNSRNEHHYHCRCRIIATSEDGADTFPFQNIRLDETLVDPACDGSLISHNNVLFFSNPANPSARVNMTLRWSLDFGKSWDGALVINAGSSEYSCLSSIDDNHVGLLYEKGGYKEMSFAKIRIN
ncbi:neuraminidase 1-like precursor [Saccoglossus kowalevskii]|uniref:Sialidase-1 n=1 Tax=Saccoglossus kowalevskii TaxID=10224 RepID=K0Q5Y7_SACKO|nr:neuraminidase 1-like precursor [Saccoglossus kowalevskii]ALR88583.1 sialidase 1-like 167 [Saccoglossus kowalevskii]DAA35222.1 TPA_inf: sialidase NEU1.1 [Saccoglossus kowalevskii]